MPGFEDAVAVSEGPSGVTGTASAPAPSGELERMEITPSHNGGFVIKEYFKSGPKNPGMEPKTSVAKDLKHLDEIIDSCFGLSGAYAQDEEAGETTPDDESAEGDQSGEPSGTNEATSPAPGGDYADEHA